MVALNFLIHFEMQSFFKNSSHKRTKAGTTRKFLELYSSGLQISGLLDILVPQRCIGFIILKKAWAVSCQMKRGLPHPPDGPLLDDSILIWMSTSKKPNIIFVTYFQISNSYLFLIFTTNISLRSFLRRIDNLGKKRVTAFQSTNDMTYIYQ